MQTDQTKCAVFSQIVATPAKTIEGFRVKARLYRLLAGNSFPKPICVTPGRKAWPLSTVQAWPLPTSNRRRSPLLSRMFSDQAFLPSE
jgi:hypothetical protein